MTRLLLFDYDGVLANSIDRIVEHAIGVSRSLGYSINVTPDVISSMPVMEFEYLGRVIGISEQHINAFTERIIREFADDDFVPSQFEGIDRAVKNLARRNILSIISGNSRHTINKFLHKYELMDCFHTVYSKELEGTKTEKIRLAMKEHQVPGSSTYMIGDAKSDMESAHMANVPCVAVLWGNQKKELLLESRPDFIAERPDDLLRIFNS